jgi:hypothetical protein
MRGVATALALGVIAWLALAPAAPASSLRRPGKVRASFADGRVVLKWRDRAEGESRYEVRYRIGAKKKTRRVKAKKHRFALVLQPGARVSLRVRACNRGGCSAWSRTVAARAGVAGATGGGGSTGGGSGGGSTGGGGSSGGGSSGTSPTVGGCPVFPADNPWNQDVSRLAVDPRSDRYVASISAAGDRFLHADFGGGGAYGIPFRVVPPSQPLVPVSFTAYGDESDPGPYPIPSGAPVEGGSDSHVLVVRQGECKLYELFAAQRAGEGWEAANGAVFDLRSNAVRPKGWTSADAAGLPILPGLARYDEVAAGAITHALRFTVEDTQRGFIFPARHFASSAADPDLPPMGLRLRLKASYDITRFSGESRVILTALKRFGMIVADNGTSWYVTGASDPRWNDEDLDQLKTVPGSAFEVVKTGAIER